MTQANRSILLPIILIVIVDVLAFTMILPLLPFYAEHYGATPFEVGMLTSSFALASLVGGPILGRWSDRYGRRRVLMLSQAGTLLGLLVTAWGPTWLAAWAPPLVWVFAGRIIAGATAANLAVAQATIADVTEPAKRSRAFGIIGAAFGLGFLIGPAISALLVTLSLVGPLLGAAALTVVSLFFTAAMIPAKTRDAGQVDPPLLGMRALLTIPGIGKLLLQLFAYTLSFFTFTAGLALFCERRYTWNGQPFHVSEVGWVLAAVGLWGLIVQGGLIRPLLKRLGERRLVVVGFALTAIGFALLAPAAGLGLFALSALISGLGTGVLRPSLMGLISQTAPAAAQGSVIGFTQSLNSLSMVIGGVVSGYLIHIGALGGYALTVAGAAAIGGLLTLL